MTGIKTIRQGERVAIWNKPGRARFGQEANTAELEHTRTKEAEQATPLRSMEQIRVGLTRCLVARCQNPGRLTHTDGDSARLHLQEQ